MIMMIIGRRSGPSKGTVSYIMCCLTGTRVCVRVRVPLPSHHCEQGLREEGGKHEAPPHHPSPLGPACRPPVFLQGLGPSVLVLLGASVRGEQLWGQYADSGISVRGEQPWGQYADSGGGSRFLCPEGRYRDSVSRRRAPVLGSPTRKWSCSAHAHRQVSGSADVTYSPAQ